MKQKKCNCEEEETDNTMNYLLLGGIVIIIYLVMNKKC